MNPHRGEVEIPFRDGRKIVVRPDFTFIASVESATGKPVMTLAKTFMTADFSIKDVAAILLAAGRQHDETFTHPEACQIIDAEGMNVFVTPFMTLLSNALKGSKSVGPSTTEVGSPKPGEKRAPARRKK